MRIKSLTIIAILISIGALAAACSRATENFDQVNKTADGKALSGYDPVAYFSAEKPTKGDAQYAYSWNGASWLFSSAENLEKFRSNPEAYAPQFGGYCAYAVSEGHTANGDPEAWKIVDGKLYLNYNKEIKQKWEENQTERIEKGVTNWEGFKKNGLDQKAK